MDKLKPFDITLSGRHLVEASAGTGKTYNITSLFIRFLVEKGMDVGKILVLTYTKAATAELKERILKRLRESVAVLENRKAPGDDDFLAELVEMIDRPGEAIARLENAIHHFDESSIFTIHAFCQRALNEQSFMGGIVFDSHLVPDDSELVQETVDDYWRVLIENADKNTTDRVWLNILYKENYSPDTIYGIISKGLGKPYLTLEMAKPEGKSRDKEVDKLVNLYNSLKVTWLEEREEIIQLLLSDAMDRRSYKSNNIANWAAGIDTWFGEEWPSLVLPHMFERFLMSYIKTNGVLKGREAPSHSFFSTADEFVTQVERLRGWLPAFKKEILEYTRRNVRLKKLSAGELGYDDYLVLLEEALADPKRGPGLARYLRAKYPVALVDEFQDTDPVQYAILQSIYRSPKDTGNNTGLFLIGDPKQSIYSFRGADVFSYLEARKQVPADQNYGLKYNFRSNSRLIESTNAIWRRNVLESPFMIDEIGFKPAEAGHKQVKPLDIDGEVHAPVTFIRSEYQEKGESLNKDAARARSAGVAAESIARLLSEGAKGNARIGDDPVEPKHIAVLVRKHIQGELIRQELIKRGLKSVQYSKKSVFETDEARNMELLLKAIAEPKNEGKVRTALATNLFSYTGEELAELVENEQEWINMLDRFSEWHRLWQERGFAVMFKSFMKAARVGRQLVSLERGERKLTNTFQVGELLQAREQEEQAGVFELLRWLAYKRQEPDNDSDEEQLRLESDEDLIKIVTMHRSKGLEYPVVYIPFLWDGKEPTNSDKPFIFHDPGRGYRACLDLNEKNQQGRARNRFQAAKESLSESLRLAYVAMTRACQHCSVVYEPGSGIEYSALGYLLLGKEPIEKHLENKILSDGSTKAVPAEIFTGAFEDLLEDNRSNIGLELVDETHITRLGVETGRPASPARCRKLKNRDQIESRGFVSSFSSIMHPSVQGKEELTNDELYLPEDAVQEESEEKNVFTFPRGPGPGTCIHYVFEEIDFNVEEDRDIIIKEALARHDIAADWESVVEKMVDTVLGYNLEQGLRLGDVTEKDLVKEMEFYFDLGECSREAVVEAIRDNNGDRGKGSAEFRIPPGFMKGYIDLVFRSGGRYYILDYKTNYLGDTNDNYRQEQLKEEMINAGYDVQYHIYTLALFRYLDHHLPEFDYSSQYGGVFYLFLRGMGGDTPGNGVFFDRPDENVIRNLDNIFKMGGGSA